MSGTDTCGVPGHSGEDGRSGLEEGWSWMRTLSPHVFLVMRRYSHQQLQHPQQLPRQKQHLRQLKRQRLQPPQQQRLHLHLLQQILIRSLKVNQKDY